MKNNFYYFIFLVVLPAFFICSCSRKTDRDLILEMMDQVEDLAAKKNVSGLMELVEEDYTDFEGRGRGETEDLIQSYFRDYRGIVIHILSTRFDDLQDFEASIRTEVVLSSGGAEIFRKLVRLAGSFYRFRLKLRKTDARWRIFYGEWEEIGLEDLFPESLPFLKKISPDL
ncbi:MAG: hypothetical protein WCC06_13310 [Candidatus Aminicenantales bacterium]